MLKGGRKRKEIEAAPASGATPKGKRAKKTPAKSKSAKKKK